MMANISEQAINAINEGIERGDCIVEMEALGLPQRIINALEESAYQIITLKQLMFMTKEDLIKITNVGEVALSQIYRCLSQYHELGDLASEYAD